MKRIFARLYAYFYNEWLQYNEIRLGIIQLRPCIRCGKKQMFRLIISDGYELPCVCNKCSAKESEDFEDLPADLLTMPEQESEPTV